MPSETTNALNQPFYGTTQMPDATISPEPETTKVTVDSNEDQNTVKADASPQPPAPLSPVRLVILFFVNLIVIGLVQLLGWGGKGQDDPFIEGGLTVLQVTAIIASAIQIVGLIPSYIFQTEKFYDITGTFTYLSCLTYSFAGGHEMSSKRLGRPVDVRACVATGCVAVWALRLGLFLFTRVMTNHKDSRFDEFKTNILRFGVVWNMQGLWSFLGCLPTFILNSTQDGSGFVWTDVVGPVVFLLGLIGEVVADAQKTAFNKDPANKRKWIDVGLWKYSRHPNYFCEWLLHLGLFIFSTAELRDSQWIAVISPVFIAFLLAFVSGVPLLEKRADEKWGGNAEYEDYKRQTSICIPLPPLGRCRESALKYAPKFLV